MAHIALQLAKKKLDEKLVLCQTFETKLPGKANVPTAKPTVLELTGKRTAIIAKRADLAGTRALVLQLEGDLANLEKDLDGLLTTEAATIESATAGDEAKILTTGAPIRGHPQPVGPVGAPQDLSASGGDMEGTIDAHWTPEKGAVTYTGEYSLGPTGPFTQFYVGSKSSATATGLTSGTIYYLRVKAVGANGPDPWSDIAQRRAT
jgi:hypothetical protein